MSAERLEVLATAVDVLGGPWTTGRAHRLYRTAGVAPGRRTARLDLMALARRGRIVAHRTPDGGVYYTRWEAS